MPIDYNDYHPKWTLISRLIRKRRAKNRCEWCGLPNGLVIDKETRRYPAPAQWELFHEDLYNPHSDFTYSALLKRYGFTKVVLTVAHIDHDKNNNHFKNLAALCQKCHLTHDIKEHVNNRKYGRNYKRDQLKLEL